MKKYIGLFVILMGICGGAFGQKEPTILWEEFIDGADSKYLFGVPTRNFAISPIGNVMTFSLKYPGNVVYDKNGELVLKLGYDVSTTFFPLPKLPYCYKNFVGDSLLLLNEDFEPTNKISLSKLSNDFVNPIKVEDGVIIITQNKIYKYDFSGKQLWESDCNCHNDTFLRPRKSPYSFITKTGINKFDIIILNNIGEKIVEQITVNQPSLIHTQDKGFWLILNNIDENTSSLYSKDFTVTKYDSSGKKIVTVNSNTFVANTGKPLIKSDFSITLKGSFFSFFTSEKFDSINFVEIETSGTVKVIKLNLDKNSTITSPYININMLNDNKFQFEISDNNSSKHIIGVGDLENSKIEWYKDIDKKYEVINGSDNYGFMLLENKDNEPSIFSYYNFDQSMRWTFKGLNLKIAASINDFIYFNFVINNENFISKILRKDGTIIWTHKFTKNRYFQIKQDSEGNDYIMYDPTNQGNYNLDVDYISKNTLKLSKFYQFPRALFLYRFPEFEVDIKRKILTIMPLEYQIDGYPRYVVRKYSIDCSIPLESRIQVVSKSGVCSDENVKLSTDKQNGFSYQWQKDGLDIPNYRDAIYYFRESGTYTVKIRDEICQTEATSNGVKINMLSLPTAEIKAFKTALCEGDKTTINATTNGVFFQWQKDQKDIPNATLSTFEATQAGDYRVGVRDDKCPQVGYSNIVPITLKPSPEAIITTDIKTVIYEPFTVKMTANSGTNLSYQWLKDEVIIDNATTNIYEAKKSGKYKVSVTKDGCLKTSEALTISIQIPLANEGEIGEETIQIYPNPSRGEFKIILPKTLQNADIQLFDVLGRERKLIHTGEQVQADGLVQGTYFLRVNKGERSVVNKIVIE